MAKFISDFTLIDKSALAATTSFIHGRDTARALGDRDVRMNAADFANRQPREVTVASSATPTPDSDITDIFTVTALLEAAAFAIPTGTPTQGQRLVLRIKDDGTARALTYDAIYRVFHVSLPTTTTISQLLYIFLIYDSTQAKWDVVDVFQQDGAFSFAGLVNGRDIAADGTTLDLIEASATADQTNAEIKTAYEANADTNEFSDAEQSKLAGIETAAKDDQTDAEIKTAYEANADTNAFDDAEQTKLAAIEALADVTDNTNVAAAGATMDADTSLAGNAWFLDEAELSSNDATKAASQASIKVYIDARDAGLDPKAAVLNATTANITLSGEQTIDGILTSTSRILVKDQSAGAENGIYVTAAGAWARSSDASADAEVTTGMYMLVVSGTANGKKGFFLSTADPVTVGVTALVFELFSDATAAPVDSVHGRTGAVVSVSGDYNADQIDETGAHKMMIPAERTKLAGIESLATVDQTNAEIRAAVEAASDSNIFTDVENTKLGAIEVFATADQTAAEIKTAYESNANTNEYDDAEQSKLGSIEESATTDQTNAEIKTAYEANADTNEFSDAEQSKLVAIEASADVTDATNVDAAGAVMGTDINRRTIWIPATAMRPTTTAGCAALVDIETATNKILIPVLDFDSATEEHAQFSIVFPKSWDLGALQFQAHWTAAGGQTGGLDGVAWGLQAMSFDADDALDQAFGSEVVIGIDAAQTGLDLWTSTVSGAMAIGGTPADEDLCIFQISRVVASVSPLDDRDEDARLIGIQVFYNVNSPTDA